MILTCSFFIWMSLVFFVSIRPYIGNLLFISIILILSALFIYSVIIIGKKQKELRSEATQDIISKKEKLIIEIAMLILVSFPFQYVYLSEYLLSRKLDLLKSSIIMYGFTVLFLLVFNVACHTYFKKYDDKVRKLDK